MPRCEGGVGCLACWEKWRDRQKELAAERAKEKNRPPLRFRRPISGKRFLVTAAQNATPVHEDFFKALKVAAKAMDAEIVVIPLRYKNPTSTWSGSRKNEEWWGIHPKLEKDHWERGVFKKGQKNPLADYLFDGRKKLNDNLALVGDVKTQPTAQSPLTRFESLTGAESCIIGHTKLQLKVVPVPTGRLPKILTTTGACTVPNYTDSKAGKLGEFHHTLGAVLVEIQSDKTFHIRQINGLKSDGSFIDLDQRYTVNGVEDAPPALGLVMGDTHARFADPDVDEATFGEGGIVETLNPQSLVFHDILDGFSVNPHHRRNPFIASAKAKSGLGNIKEEIEHVVDFLRDRVGDRNAVIVASNHDKFLTRWINDTDWKDDPVNADFYLETALMMDRSAKVTSRGVECADPFTYWLRKLGLSESVRCLATDESFKLYDIECGMHGNIGPKGAIGTLSNMSRLGVRVITGHSHTPGIEEGHYQCGTSTPLRLDYNHGPNSWLNTHCVVYANGKRSLITIVDGSWRA